MVMRKKKIKYITITLGRGTAVKKIKKMKIKNGRYYYNNKLVKFRVAR